LPQSSKVAVFSVDGKKAREIELPKVFFAELEPEIIRRAVLAMQSARKQPKGTKEGAGMKVAELKNRRTLIAGRVGNVPQAVGGRRAHPPKVEKKIEEKINKKEKKKALISAIAYTKEKEAIAKRHKVPEAIELPIVVEDKFEALKKTKEVLSVLERLGLSGDIAYAKEKTKRRAGKGKARGRKLKKKKSILIITAKEASVYRAARNLIGVDICSVSNLNAELLAPGGMPGRLTIWTESAIKKLDEVVR